MIENVKLSKIISQALRHDPTSYGINLIENGWAKIGDLCNAIKRKNPGFINICEKDIYKIVQSAKKQRHEIKDGMIRAIYGHSNKLSITYNPVIPPAKLYHGTNKLAFKNILLYGLKPMNRLYVHLSSNLYVAHEIGLRKQKVPIVLIIRAFEASKLGVEFYTIDKDIWLTEFIPPDFITTESSL